MIIIKDFISNEGQLLGTIRTYDSLDEMHDDSNEMLGKGFVIFEFDFANTYLSNSLVRVYANIRYIDTGSMRNTFRSLIENDFPAVNNYATDAREGFLSEKVMWHISNYLTATIITVALFLYMTLIFPSLQGLKSSLFTLLIVIFGIDIAFEIFTQLYVYLRNKTIQR